MNFSEFIQETRPMIGEAVSQECDRLAQGYQDIPGSASYADMLCEYTLRGKLLRGAFVRLAGESFGNPKIEDILRAAAAVELAQSAFLIHDDIMDNDELRRGKASLHTLIGKNAAICLGDLALLYSFSLLSAPLVPVFSSHLAATALGQAYEVTSAEKNTELSLEEIFTVICNKTARYTFVLPLEAGAALSGLFNEPQLAELGRSLGLIFQIRDDELNLLSPSQTGKSAGGDIRENKKTYCRAQLLRLMPEAESLFGRVDTLSQVQEFYQKSGAAAATSEFLAQEVRKAQGILDTLSIKKETRPLWGGLLEFLNTPKLS